MILQFVTKEDLIERAKNLKFFNKRLEEIDNVQTYLKETGGGLVKWMKAEEDYSAEMDLIEKIKTVKAVVDEYGDVAINKYKTLTEEPDKTHPAYDSFQVLKNLGLNIDEVFIQMSKKEFEIYLEVYNTIFKK